MTAAAADAVERFYDFHPINARQILDAVAARGIATASITEEVLQHHDQLHLRVRHVAVAAGMHPTKHKTFRRTK